MWKVSENLILGSYPLLYVWVGAIVDLFTSILWLNSYWVMLDDPRTNIKERIFIVINICLGYRLHSCYVLEVAAFWGLQEIFYLKKSVFSIAYHGQRKIYFMICYFVGIYQRMIKSKKCNRLYTFINILHMCTYKTGLLYKIPKPSLIVDSWSH